MFEGKWMIMSEKWYKYIYKEYNFREGVEKLVSLIIYEELMICKVFMLVPIHDTYQEELFCN